MVALTNEPHDRLLGGSRSRAEGLLTKRPRGFSLVELLVVVAIILIVAAIAIPKLLHSRIAANQASAVGSLRLLNTANITYASTYNTGYAAQMSYLGPGNGGSPAATQAGLIDTVLAGSSGNTSAKSGYNFVYAPGATDTSGRINSYQFNAGPAVVMVTGMSYYFTDQTGVIRENDTAQASSSDSPVAG